MKANIHTAFSVVSSFIVLTAIVLGIALVGSPSATRSSRFDRQRLNDLRTIVREIDSLCRSPGLKGQLKQALPKSLDELAAKARRSRIRLADPETGEEYKYEITSESSYRLCATFSKALDMDADVFWNHSTGEHCYSIDALDPP